MPKYIVFAGPNGCGKSTLYHTNSNYSELPRINFDEIARENGLDWKKPRAWAIVLRSILSMLIQFN